MAVYFNRSAQAVKMRASTLELGRRKSIPKPEPIVVKDEQLEAENKALKADIDRITTAFDSLIETFQTINVELKKR